ncbi:MAG: glycosyltransferase family 4 protein [Acidobacteriota bacterium]|nr:glycosyltransferase family 4 protein [Acidobacteriota bacterium]
MLRLALVGGIYGKPPEYRQRCSITPETTLEAALRERDIDVQTFSHTEAMDVSRFDLVHVHHLGWGALSAAVAPCGPPLAFTVHAFVERDAAERGPRLPSKLSLAMRFVLARVDALVSLTEREQRFMQSQFPTVGALCRTIPNGISPTIYPRARRPRRGVGEPWRLLYVGQLIEGKRVDVLLEAVRRLDHPVRLRLVYQAGDREAELMRLAAHLGIRDRVEFIGSRTPAELAQLLNDTDVFTFPSASEALPSVITEAMLCGTPILTTDVGGIPEQLGSFGCMVPPNSVEAFASALNGILEQYDPWIAQSEPMRAHAIEKYSVAAMVDAHLQLYADVLAARTCRRERVLALPATVSVRGLVRLRAQRREPSNS